MELISKENRNFLTKLKDNVKDLQRFLKEKSVPCNDIIFLCDLCEKKLVELNNKVVDNIKDLATIESKEYIDFTNEINNLDLKILTVKGLAKQKIELKNQHEPE